MSKVCRACYFDAPSHIYYVGSVCETNAVGLSPATCRDAKFCVSSHVIKRKKMAVRQGDAKFCVSTRPVLSYPGVGMRYLLRCRSQAAISFLMATVW